MLGLLLRTGLAEALSDPAAAEFVRGLAAGCDEAGLSLQIVDASGTDSCERVSHAAVDAFVAWSLVAEDPALQAALARRVPIVAFGGTDQLDEVPYVAADNLAGGRAVARHVMSTGIDRVAVVTCRLETKEYADRVRGWRHELEEAGTDWDQVLVVDQQRSSREEGRCAAAAVIDAHQPGTRWAVLAITDVLALGIVHALADAGLSVPDDVAVAGFDDIDEAAASAPTLTTVRQDIDVLGRECALRAAGRITGVATPHPTSLVVRGSTSVLGLPADGRPS